MKEILNKKQLNIRETFNSASDLEDIVNIINTLFEEEIREKKIQPLKLKTVTFYLKPENKRKAYKTFEIPKKSGGHRIIHQPEKGLKWFLKGFSLILNETFTPSEFAHGFVSKKSIISNASKHIGKQYVMNIDLKNFFHSIDLRRVKYFLMNINPALKNNEELAYKLASLCTYEIEINGQKKHVLPQGSPASPILTNLVCSFFDKKMAGLARRFNMNYSRYADDITFSAYRNNFQNDDFQEELKRLVEINKFEINQNKTRIQSQGFRQEVTGLTVNQKVNVSKKYIKELRRLIYLWEQYGYRKANNIVQISYGNGASLELILDGKLSFLRQVKGEKDSVYFNLLKRRKKLKTEKTYSLKENSKSPKIGKKTSLLAFSKMIDSFLNEGFEKVINKYDD